HTPMLLDDAARDAILAAIPEASRGVFLAMATMGLRPGEARALEVRDYADGWITVQRAAKDYKPEAAVAGTKTGRVRRLPCSPELEAWIAAHVDPAARLTRAPMFTNPEATDASGRWGHAALWKTWRRASMQALGRPVKMYEATRHSFATLALGRGA